MKIRRKDYAIGICFLLPALALITCFIIYPVLDTLYLSFHSWKGIFGTPKNWVGTDNYVSALTSSLFWNSMKNSFLFIVGGFCVLLPLSFGLALLITSKMRGTRIMKTAYFMPVILGTTTVALIDGCGQLQKLCYITLPLCKNSFKIFSVLCVTGCLKVFGRSSAYSIILLVCGVALSLIMNRIFQQEDDLYS